MANTLFAAVTVEIMRTCSRAQSLFTAAGCFDEPLDSACVCKMMSRRLVGVFDESYSGLVARSGSAAD